MFTVCPKCTLTLVVTTVDLRAGQGYVRCGRCANVFNALIALREGDPSGGSPSESARRRVLETPPQQPVEPAMGAGVAVDPEPEPEPEPGPDAAPESEPLYGGEPEGAEEPDSGPNIIVETEVASTAEVDIDFDALLGEAANEESGQEVPAREKPAQEEPAQEAVAESADATESEDAALEFDDTSTDVADIFISPPEAERGAGSGSYEAVVLAVEPPSEVPEPPPEVLDDESHTETIAADDWSLLDDDEPPAEDAPPVEEPPADAESVIEESPLAADADEEAPAEKTPAGDPPWVEEMFAEAEADALRARTAEHPALDLPLDEGETEEPAAVRAARDVAGVSAPSGDTVLEPLLAPAKPPRPPWQYITGVAVLSLVLALQVVHRYRHRLVLSPTVGSLVSSVYGWFGATITPIWDLGAYTVTQQGADAEGGEGERLRVRLSLQNDSDRVQPLPLLRLTLLDRFNGAVATRDLEPREYLPPRAADLRLLEPDQRIDAELHVIDPGKTAVGFVIDACLRAENGSIGCANDARRRAAG